MRRSLLSRLAWPAILFGTLAGTVALTFADRAPGIVKAIAAPFRRALPRIEQALGINWIDRNDVPFENDTLGHMALWMTITAITIVAARDRFPTRWLVAMLVVGALLTEYAQPLLSSSRSMTVSDFGANLAGICFGIVAGLIGRWIMSTRLIRSRQSSLA